MNHSFDCYYACETAQVESFRSFCNANNDLFMRIDYDFHELFSFYYLFSHILVIMIFFLG